mmetsp:Transcript_13302/g.22593  ORF Transcript_13302/g.22593 Transcript_13302/m.22593 type:complete len:129 (-) Transcript_13302:857-1243(-)
MDLLILNEANECIQEKTCIQKVDGFDDGNQGHGASLNLDSRNHFKLSMVEDGFNGCKLLLQPKDSKAAFGLRMLQILDRSEVPLEQHQNSPNLSNATGMGMQSDQDNQQQQELFSENPIDLDSAYKSA